MQYNREKFLFLHFAGGMLRGHSNFDADMHRYKGLRHRPVEQARGNSDSCRNQCSHDLNVYICYSDCYEEANKAYTCSECFFRLP